MNTKTITCSSIVQTQAFNNLLAEANIKSTINDGAGDWVVQRVPNQAVEVVVSEEDYERALTLFSTLPKAVEESIIWCPKCGSEEITKLSNSEDTKSGFFTFLKSLLSLLCVLHSNNYICKKCGHKFYKAE